MSKKIMTLSLIVVCCLGILIGCKPTLADCEELYQECMGDLGVVLDYGYGYELSDYDYVTEEDCENQRILCERRAES